MVDVVTMIIVGYLDRYQPKKVMPAEFTLKRGRLKDHEPYEG